MIGIGVQTKGILLEQGIDRGFSIIRNAGFTRVDFNLDAFLLNTDVYAGRLGNFYDNELEDLVDYFLQYRRGMEKYGLKASQMHASYPFYIFNRDKQNEYMQGNVIPKSIVIAETLGVPWVVVHPAKLKYVAGKEAEQAINLEYYMKLVPLLKQCHIGICMENLYEIVGNHIVEGPCADPEEANMYIDFLNEYAGEELFGLCLDTGHLQLVKRKSQEYIRTVGKRLKILHLHENDAIGDLHQMPYTFGRTSDDGLDWKGVAKALKEIGFDGTLSFETYPCMNSFPDEMEEAVLSTIYDIGCSIREEIESE